MKKITFLTLLLAAGSAMAESAGVSEAGIRYNEVSVGYVNTSASGTYTGYSVAGSWLVDKNIVIDGSYVDMTKSSSSIASTNVNVGYRMGIATNVDIGVRVGYIDQVANTSDSSYVVGAAIGALVAPNITLSGNASYTGLDSTTYIYGANIAYYLTDNLTARATYRGTSGDSDTTSYTVSVGYNF